MRHCANVALAIATVASATSVAAQDRPPRITLREAVTLHAANNLDLRLARADAAARIGETRTVAPYPNPVAGVTYESLSDAGRDAGETYLTLSQELVWPWVVTARGAAVRHTRAAAAAGVTADSARLVFEMKRAYVAAWLAERRHEILERVVAVFRDADTSAQERLAAGDLSGYERRRIQLERTRYERLLAASAITLGDSRRALATRVMPDSAVAEIAPSDLPAPPLPSPDIDALLDRAIETHPAVVAARRSYEAARARIQAIRRARVPAPTLTAGYKSQRDGLDGLFLGAALPLPVFNRRGGAVQTAGARESTAQAHVALARRVVRNDVRRTAERFRVAVRQLERVSTGELDATEDLLDIARTSYAEGEMSLLGLLDAAATFADLGPATHEITTEYWISLFDLERALGTSLDIPLGEELDR